MTPYNTSERQLEDLLAAVTDALIAERRPADAVPSHLDAKRAEIEPYLGLIERLRSGLVAQQPSDRFVRRLKSELLGEPQRGVVSRMRRLPARVQIAAAFALLAGSGAMLIFRRRQPGLSSLTGLNPADDERGEVVLAQH